MQILGLDVCRDTIVGDEMIRGISGGQKKRVTTGSFLLIFITQVSSFVQLIIWVDWLLEF